MSDASGMLTAVDTKPVVREVDETGEGNSGLAVVALYAECELAQFSVSQRHVCTTTSGGWVSSVQIGG